MYIMFTVNVIYIYIYLFIYIYIYIYNYIYKSYVFLCVHMSAIEHNNNRMVNTLAKATLEQCVGLSPGLPLALPLPVRLLPHGGTCG